MTDRLNVNKFQTLVTDGAENYAKLHFSWLSGSLVDARINVDRETRANSGTSSAGSLVSLANVLFVFVTRAHMPARKWKRLLSSTFHRRNFLRPFHGILLFVPRKLWERERGKSSTYDARESNRPPTRLFIRFAMYSVVCMETDELELFAV